MATFTNWFNLIKPNGADGGDLVNVDNINDNMDVIDSTLHDHDLGIASADTRLDSHDTKLTAIQPFSSQFTQSPGVGGISTVETIVGGTLGPFHFDSVQDVEVIFAWYNLVKTVATDTFFMRLYMDATMIQQYLVTTNGSGNCGGGQIIGIAEDVPIGDHSFTARCVRNSGTGSISTVALPGPNTNPLIVRPFGIKP